jgi:hypothetical protein
VNAAGNEYEIEAVMSILPFSNACLIGKSSAPHHPLRITFVGAIPFWEAGLFLV